MQQRRLLYPLHFILQTVSDFMHHLPKASGLNLLSDLIDTCSLQKKTTSLTSAKTSFSPPH
jgi:hypothetical protein